MFWDLSPNTSCCKSTTRLGLGFIYTKHFKLNWFLFDKHAVTNATKLRFYQTRYRPCKRYSALHWLVSPPDDQNDNDDEERTDDETHDSNGNYGVDIANVGSTCGFLSSFRSDCWGTSGNNHVGLHLWQNGGVVTHYIILFRCRY